MNYRVIINKHASSGNGALVLDEVEAVFKEKKIAYEVLKPESIADAISTVERITDLKKGEDDVHLIVLGGDGTLNTVLQGIHNFEKTRISCIKTGSGNDFARNMNLRRRPEDAIRHILETPDEVLLDYGELNKKESPEAKGEDFRFIISCGIGYDADICAEANNSPLKKLLNRLKIGRMIYLTVGIKQIFSRQCSDAWIRFDDEEAIHVKGLFFVVGMLHKYEGGGVPFCPKADPRDGLLDVCIVRDMPRWKLAMAVMLVYLEKHSIFKEVSFAKCKKMTVTTSVPEWYHTDGEVSNKIRHISMEAKKGLRFVM